MNDKIECENCVRLKEMANELQLEQLDKEYHIKSKLQLKKELDEAKKELDEAYRKLESIRKIIKQKGNKENGN